MLSRVIPLVKLYICSLILKEVFSICFEGIYHTLDKSLAVLHSFFIKYLLSTKGIKTQLYLFVFSYLCFCKLVMKTIPSTCVLTTFKPGFLSINKLIQAAYKHIVQVLATEWRTRYYFVTIVNSRLRNYLTGGP